MNVLIYCADIGSVARGRFGWARSGAQDVTIDQGHGSIEILELVDMLATDLVHGHRVALGFECPLFVPVPKQSLELGKARPGEANRSWSASAGTGALATGLVEVAWILSELRARLPDVPVYLDWRRFTAAGSGLFLWEAFVTAEAKAVTHVDDATIAVEAFRKALPDPTRANAVAADRPLSLLGAALVWSGCSEDPALLHTPCLVIKARSPAAPTADRGSKRRID